MARASAALLLLALLLAGPHAAHAHGDVHDQIVTLSKQLRAHPRDAALYHKRGELHRAHEDHAAALADYARAERLDPTLAVVHLSRGRVLLESGRPAGAIASLTRFLESEPDHAEARLLRARAYARLRQHARAEEEFAALLARATDPLPDLYLERATNLSAMGEPGQALAVIEDGLRRFGSLVVLEDAALELELSLSRFDAAIARLDRLAAAAQRKETLLARKATVWARAGNAAKAEEARAQALTAIEKLPEDKRKVPAMLALVRELEGRKR